MTPATSVPLSRRRLLGGMAAASAAAALPLAGCASRPAGPEPHVQPLGQSTFAAYAADTRAWIESRRHWTGPDRALEIRANAPAETRPPAGRANGGGVLCIHGLGDSPWSFVDQAAALARAGWLVRTVLLPGCGTRPEDMIAAGAGDWRRVVREQTAILARDLAHLSPGRPHPLWLAGFSTGCNLAVEAALAEDSPVDGLLLFSPALAVRTRLSFMAPVARPFVTWLRKPEDALMGGQTAFRYTTVPVAGLAAFVDTMRTAVGALEARTLDIPVVAALARGDSIVESETVMRLLSQRLTSPETRLIWYGADDPLEGRADARLIRLSDRIPEERIERFSHMALTYSPENPEYGRSGRARLCSAGRDRPTPEACRRGDVRYGARAEDAPGEVRARLSFNPHFETQARIIAGVMDKTLR